MPANHNVLVTGGAGYVGSHTCKALALAGYVPVTLDNLTRGHSSAVRWGPLVRGDVGDRVVIDNVLAEFQPVAVMHFAGFAYVNESVSRPEHYYRNNAFNTLSLLEGLRDHKIDAGVFSSTCATYGVPDSIPIREVDPQRPVSPYGESKLMVEWMLGGFGAAYGMKFATLRYFNAAGSDPDGEIGWSHDPETRLVPRALMAARGDIPHLEIFGDDFDTSDGTCIRDYIHVSDLADAHVLAVEYLISGGISTSVNLGTGCGHSVQEVVRAAEKSTGRVVPVRVVPRRIGDPPVLVADPSRANEILRFSPRLSSLEIIVDTAWRWMSQHP